MNFAHDSSSVEKLANKTVGPDAIACANNCALVKMLVIFTSLHFYPELNRWRTHAQAQAVNRYGGTQSRCEGRAARPIRATFARLFQR
jgi:hypothetical protein